MTNDLIGEYPKLNLFLDNFEKTYKGTLIMNEAGLCHQQNQSFLKISGIILIPGEKRRFKRNFTVKSTD